MRLIYLSIITLFLGISCQSEMPTAQAPILLFADGQLMLSLKEGFQNGDPEVTPLVNTLLRCAE